MKPLVPLCVSAYRSTSHAKILGNKKSLHMKAVSDHFLSPGDMWTLRQFAHSSGLPSKIIWRCITLTGKSSALKDVVPSGTQTGRITVLKGFTAASSQVKDLSTHCLCFFRKFEIFAGQNKYFMRALLISYSIS